MEGELSSMIMDWPLKNVTINAPDIDIMLPQILACVVLFFTSIFSILKFYGGIMKRKTQNKNVH